MTTQSASQSGPFIVTTKRKVDQPLVKISGTATPQPGFFPKYETARRAVATLEEARALLFELGAGPFGVPTMSELESGGSVGPLSDGTVIEVEATTYHALWHAVPWDSGLRGGPYMETDGSQNIAGFNAYQEACRAA